MKKAAGGSSQYGRFGVTCSQAVTGAVPVQSIHLHTVDGKVEAVEQETSERHKDGPYLQDMATMFIDSELGEVWL